VSMCLSVCASKFMHSRQYSHVKDYLYALFVLITRDALQMFADL